MIDQTETEDEVTMQAISQVFVLTGGGESLIWKNYRYDIQRDTAELFFQRVKDASVTPLIPVINDDGIWLYHIKRQGLYFVATSKMEVTPIVAIEFLTKLVNILKDFCGVLNEESVRGNIVLVYEVLDEIMDFGFIQIASTEKLKPYIHSDPLPVKSEQSPEMVNSGLFGIEHRTAPSNAANKPVIRSRWDQETRKNEIFVDVIERLTVLVSNTGSVARCEVSGQVNVKSFLVGCPDIKIGLNEDLTIGKADDRKGYGHTVNLDTCSFHSCVGLTEFEETRLLTIRPPEGEFPMMTYQVHGDLPHGLPFRLLSHIVSSPNSSDLEVNLKLRCEIPSSTHAVNVSVSLPVPKVTTGLSQQLSGPGQSAEFLQGEKKVKWLIKKLLGKSEATAKFKLIIPNGVQPNRSELGPAVLDFEISGFVSSNLQIRFLRVFDQEHSYVPLRWIRYITVTDSYVLRL